MSDIIEKITPSEEALAGDIVFCSFKPYITARSANSDLIYNTGEGSYIRFYRFTHENRVIGLVEDGRLYVLGSENIKINRGVGVYSDTPQAASYYRGTREISQAPPDGWSIGGATEDDKWLIGYVLAGQVKAPEKIYEWKYVDVNVSNFFTNDVFYQSTSDGSGGWKLSGATQETIAFKGVSDITVTSNTTEYAYNNVLKTYTNAMNAVHGSAVNAYADYVANKQFASKIYPPGFFENTRKFVFVVSNLLITSDRKAALDYLDNGKIPDDAVYDDPTNAPGGTADTGGGDSNNDSDGNAGSNVREEIPVQLPLTTPILEANTHVYALSSTQLSAFIADMWDFTWAEIATNMMTGIYNNLVDNVQSIRLFPFQTNMLGTTQLVDGISCGWWKHANNVPALTSDTSIHDVGSYSLKEVFGGWADYAPYTTCELYLPYLGWIDIDVNLFMGHDISVKYSIDVLCGILSYFILCDKTFVITKSVKVAQDIPVSLTSGIAVFSDITKNVASQAVSLASARPVGLITGSSMVTTPKLLTDATESGKLYMPTKCAVRITRPAYTRSANYAGTMGYPCYGSYKLSTLKGFTIVENYRGSYSKGIEKEEAEEIKRLLEEGVYL